MNKNFDAEGNGLISIIIPVFRSEKTIRRCLSSIVNQSYTNLEIIVVYKRSNEKDVEEMLRFEDVRLVFVEQLGDGGAGEARNIGLRLAHGEYVGFVEADDYIDPDFYKRLSDTIKRENADIAFAETKNNHGEIIVQHESNQALLTFIEQYSYLKNAASFDKIFKTSLIRKYHIEFSEGVRWEDNIFVLKAMYYSQKIVFVRGVYYHYLCQKWSEDYRKQLKLDAVTVLDEMVSFAKQKNFSKEEMLVLKKAIYNSFFGVLVEDPKLYKKYVTTFGWSFRIAYRHYKKLIKALLRTKKNLIIQKL